NDFLAVYAAEAWAVERARRGGGPTLIELVTYRRDAHSTSDDPSQYRAADEAEHWPGGDPIERLKQYLVNLGEWSDDAHRHVDAAMEQDVAATFKQAESLGSSSDHSDFPVEALFDDVYAAVPLHLRQQLDEAKSEESPMKHDSAILPFTPSDQRAAG
ncbi:MAG TPA: thiamine pyrophosphate-dependent enzyme, partial [Lacipirellulaceae bacterium]